MKTPESGARINVFDIRATAAANEQAEQRPKSEVEETRRTCHRSSQPSPRKDATGVMAPFSQN